MARKVRTGTIDITEGTRSPTHILQLADTLGRIQLRVTGNLVVTAAATLREDGVLNLLRRIEFGVGGTNVKTIGDNSRFAGGGKLRHFFNQLEYGNLPVLNQPAVGVATNPFNFTITIPFEMPPQLSKLWPRMSRRLTMLSPTPKDLELDIDWGDTADVISAGTATLTAVTAEVIAIVHPELNRARLPVLLHETTQQVQITAGANTDDRQGLNKIGNVPYIGLLGVDNSLRNDDSFNVLDFFLNTSNSQLRSSWEAMKAAAQEVAGLQAATFLPTGVNLALFDEEQNGDGVLLLDDPNVVKGFDLSVDHDALTATFRLVAHHYHVQLQGQ